MQPEIRSPASCRCMSSGGSCQRPRPCANCEGCTMSARIAIRDGNSRASRCKPRLASTLPHARMHTSAIVLGMDL